MKNLVWIGKVILLFVLALTVVDLVGMLYTFTTVSKALDSTLSSISMIVAEENCIDTTRVDEVKRLMVENCPLWLTYNDGGIRTIKENGKAVGYAPGKPTSLQQKANYSSSTNAVAEAMRNIDNNDSSSSPKALVLTSSGYDCWSYESCPQRGNNITVSLTGYYTFRVMWPWAINANATDAAEHTAGGIYLNIPITREVTVVGMKFYKGKEA